MHLNLATRDLDASVAFREGAHYGVEVEKPGDVDAAIARLRAAGYPIDVEREETCCCAVQHKVWAADPDGRTRPGGRGRSGCCC
jgi:hypothetical protein